MARPAKKSAVPPRSQEPRDSSARRSRKRLQGDKGRAARALREMLLIRRFEERAGQLYGLGLIGGFCHLYIGQEAVAVGLQSAMTVGKDSVITGYRDHGHMLAYGIDPKVIMAELTGRAAGISKGKGGSMHMFSVEHGFYGGHGIVGAQVPLGTGLALQAQIYRGWRRVPRLFRRRRGQPGPGLRELQHGQAVEAADHLRDREQPICDGHERRALVGRADLLQARRELTAFPASRSTAWTCWRCAARPRSRSNGRAAGKGPIILELKTYRYRGHSMSDPAKYRTREEVQDVREHQRPDRPCRARNSRRWA